MGDTLYNEMRKYIVFAENLQEFCEKWHKPGAITEFNRKADFEQHKADMEKYGYTIIPASTSISGRIVSYYGKIQ